MFGYIRLRFQPIHVLKLSANYPLRKVYLISFIKVILNMLSEILATPILNKVLSVMLHKKFYNFIC